MTYDSQEDSRRSYDAAIDALREKLESFRCERIGDATLYLGDCREILPLLPKVDAVVTDPPYGINTKSDGSRKISPWGDLCNAAFWYADWLKACRSLLEGKHGEFGGPLWTFLNWRSLVTFQKASCDISWPIESLLVWDKAWIGPGGTRGLRPSYEMVALFCAGQFSIENRGLADIQQWRVGSHKPNGHPAEKPIEGLLWLVENSGKVGETILDPFMGSGTTGVACAKLGRRFIGIEIEPQFFDIACKRIDEAYRQPRLFKDEPPKSKQEALL